MFQSALEDVVSGIDRDGLGRLTRSLIRVPSVFRPEEPEGNEGSVAGFIADHLRNAGFAVRVEEVAPGWPNDEDELLATCKLYAATAMYYAYGEEAHV